MGDNSQSVKITDQETGEEYILKTESLISNIRDTLLSRRKLQTQATVWSKLTEADQKDEITACQELARDLVHKAVELIAIQGNTVAHVEVTKFAVDVDKGAVQITSTGHASDDMLVDLAHAKGKTAVITIIDPRPFNEKSTKVKADSDQPSLLPDDEEAPADENVTADGDAYDPDTGEVVPDEKTDEQIAADMDADLDQMQDEDDLHADADEAAPPVDESLNSDSSDVDTGEADGEAGEIGDAPELPEDDQTSDPDFAQMSDQDATAAGQKARLDNLGPDDNPCEPDSDAFSKWAEAYAAADAEIKMVQKQGADAFVNGEDENSSKYKKGTDGHRFFMEGFNAAKAEAVAAEGVSDDGETEADIANDSYAQGAAAYERGESPDDNPYADGSPKRRFWNDGFNSMQAD